MAIFDITYTVGSANGTRDSIDAFVNRIHHGRITFQDGSGQDVASIPTTEVIKVERAD